MSDQFVGDMVCEHDRAQRLHDRINSLHEGYAVILEGMGELWEIVKQKDSRRDLGHAYGELVQIAAMAMRTADNLGLSGHASEYGHVSR